MLTIQGLGSQLPKSILDAIDAAGLGDLLRYLDALYTQGFYARCEYDILDAWSKVSYEYQDQLECAACFFSFSKMALQESLFMNCARLYDKNSSINLYELNKHCNSFKRQISSRAIELYGDHPGFIPGKPVLHCVTTAEERYYPDEVKSQHAFDCFARDGWESPVELRLSIDEMLDLHVKKLNSMSKLVDKVRDQRNKIYAHSDTELLDYDAFVDENGLTIGQVASLVDCSLDITREVYAQITGVNRPRAARNTKDIVGLLELVKLGLDAVSPCEPMRAQ